MRAQPTLCSLRTSRSGRQSPASDLTAPPPRDTWSIAVTDRKRTTNHGPTLTGKRAWQDSNLRHTAPETVALSPELQARARAEEHTSELQSRVDLVCRLLLEK